jgi:hypothetical protein
MELDKCVLYMKDGSRYVFDKAPCITMSRDYTDGYYIINTVHIESYNMEYYPKRTSKRYKKNRKGFR